MEYASGSSSDGGNSNGIGGDSDSDSGTATALGAFGPNTWLIDDMYEQYLENPESVSESWREFFADYAKRSPGTSIVQAAIVRPAAAQSFAVDAGGTAATQASGSDAAGAASLSDAVSTTKGASPAGPGGPSGSAGASGPAGVAGAGMPENAIDSEEPEGVHYEQLRGAGALIARNMEASLEVPTATSVRHVPAKLLEMERAVVNRYLAASTGAKVSFTHLVAYAIVKGLMAVPAMRSVYEHLAASGSDTAPGSASGVGTGAGSGDASSPVGISGNGGGHTGNGGGRIAAAAGGASGVARVAYHDHVNLGIAIDMKKAGGKRTLVVPVIRNADVLGFKGFVLAYEDLIRRASGGKLTVDDFQGATATITNPGTLGTAQSVPRLMQGQSVIVGVGSIAYPVEFQGADPRVMAEMGVSKTITLTSTYDHRVIQGAESGIFLGHVAECLMGEHDYYEEIFSQMDIPAHPIKWERDHHSPNDLYDLLSKQVQVQRIINMYRVRGHLIADLDPLSVEPPPMHAELDPASYGITLFDYDREFAVDNVAGNDRMRLGEALDVLRNAYCSTLAVEFTHIQDPEQKKWMQLQMESPKEPLMPEEKYHILERLNAAEAFEHFLHTRYVGQKRFGLEGAESAIVALDYIMDRVADAGIDAVVLGMAHRGRLNVLANIVGMSLTDIFQDFEGIVDPDSVQGSGDVRYHNGARGTFTARSGRQVPVAMASNPSHLEAVDPVVEGMARAIQDRLSESGGEAGGTMALLVHGDAAFAGQGVVAETLEMSQLPGYFTGGTIHLVINNQLGFTTAPQSARSSVYSTDVAKVVQAPIFHVNGDDPEACARAAMLAFAFREEFHKDVVIDMVCYRRHGHNEGDDPSYTQPRMYRIIDQRRSVRKLYAERLVHRGDVTLEKAEELLTDFHDRYQRALDETRALASNGAVPQDAVPQDAGSYIVSGESGGDTSGEPGGDISPGAPGSRGAGSGMPGSPAIDRGLVESIVRATMTVPDGFTIHPKLVRLFQKREKMLSDGMVDWTVSEALALGTLLTEGRDVRLCGQDTRRGTFSQRHAVLVDYETGAEWIPLAHLSDIMRASGRNDDNDEASGRFYAYDSLLSEYAALGFEYGYSVEAASAFVAWEAQFGDFGNGGQVMIDNFIVAAMEKWNQQSGLVMLLPHGYEGQGPEHSSARLERFLSLCANGNIRVAQPTTGAQYLHLLRSAVYSSPRTPLVVFTPKSLLRAEQAHSTVDDLVNGCFETVLDDPATRGQTSGVQASGVQTSGAPASGSLDPDRVRKIVLCTGKVAYEVMAHRGREPGVGEKPGEAVAVVRIEQVYPWPEERLNEVLSRYPNANEVVWLQEEPENMGAWSFVHGRLHAMLRDRAELYHVSRPESGSPATGSSTAHKAEHAELMRRIFSAS
ncbi:MAG: multifunctional oxoglutarate decarboxylase/oxoglutarate dehydrogenase thiamine pyrophosphate-binding subunit/dihydrolipoyllysine-residue succinyltransferase subunit [Acidimicrobiales bacterium]